MDTFEMNDVALGKGVGFKRWRRVTGYLTGDLNRFNDGKRAEERDRVKHISTSTGCCIQTVTMIPHLVQSSAESQAS